MYGWMKEKGDLKRYGTLPYASQELLSTLSPVGGGFLSADAVYFRLLAHQQC